MSGMIDNDNPLGSSGVRAENVTELRLRVKCNICPQQIFIMRMTELTRHRRDME
jgi:hypothetical protein